MTLPSNTTKDRIQRAALTEFSKYGLAGARVDRIARKARVNKAMIYYYFTSKKSLYRATIREHFASILDRIGRAVTASEQIEDVLRSFVDEYTAAFSNEPEFARIILRETAESDSRIIKMLAESVIASGLPDQVTKVFRAGIEQGRLRPVDIRQAFVSFMLSNVGYLFLAPIVDRIWNVTDRSRFMAERKMAAIDLFLHGVIR